MTDHTWAYETRPVMPWAPDDILTPDELAGRLKVSVSTIERMELPTVYCGRGKKRTRRYVWGQIVRTLEERAA
jgi:hypothetical protein